MLNKFALHFRCVTQCPNEGFEDNLGRKMRPNVGLTDPPKARARLSEICEYDFQLEPAGHPIYDVLLAMVRSATWQIRLTIKNKKQKQNIRPSTYAGQYSKVKQPADNIIQ